MEEDKKPVYKKWWFWIIVIVVIIIIFSDSFQQGIQDGLNASQTENVFEEENHEIEEENILNKSIEETENISNTTNEISESPKKELTKYEITGEELGDLGKEVILNANSDMPVKKYLYKLPEGTYTVTTSYDKLANFFIVKDNIINTGDNEYPEELDYVSEGYFLTNGDDDFNGKAKKSLKINIANDESIQTVGTETFVFEKVN